MKNHWAFNYFFISRFYVSRLLLLSFKNEIILKNSQILKIQYNKRDKNFFSEELTWRDIQHLIVYTSEYSPLR